MSRVEPQRGTGEVRFVESNQNQTKSLAAIPFPDIKSTWFKVNIFSNSSSCSTSEIWSVCGAIITTIGTLTAISGIFPNNQAQIKLYLECLGCSMIIFGTLIILLSHKMRISIQNKSHKRRLVMRRQFDTNTKDANTCDQAVAHSMELGDASFLIEARQVDIVENDQHKEALLKKNLDGDTWNCSIITGAADNHIEIVEDEDEVDRAAVEAALSIVLGAATLVGFRSSSICEGRQPNEILNEDDKQLASRQLVTCPPHAIGFNQTNNDCCCCLHHTVQHRLSAQRWIKRLYVVRHSHERNHTAGPDRS